MSVFRALLADKMPTLSPILFDQMDIEDPHTAIDGLTHIINRQKRCADAGQRFHFHTRASGGLDRAPHPDQTIIFPAHPPLNLMKKFHMQ